MMISQTLALALPRIRPASALASSESALPRAGVVAVAGWRVAASAALSATDALPPGQPSRTSASSGRERRRGIIGGGGRIGCRARRAPWSPTHKCSHLVRHARWRSPPDAPAPGRRRAPSWHPARTIPRHHPPRRTAHFIARFFRPHPALTAPDGWRTLVVHHIVQSSPRGVVPPHQSSDG